MKLSDVPFTESIDVPRLVQPCAACRSATPSARSTTSGRPRRWARAGGTRSSRTPPSPEEAEPVVAACLNCKSCRVVCPAGVDISALVLERRARRADRAMGRLFRLQAEHPRLFEGFVKTAARTRLLWDNRPGRVG